MYNCKMHPNWISNVEIQTNYTKLQLYFHLIFGHLDIFYYGLFLKQYDTFEQECNIGLEQLES